MFPFFISGLSSVIAQWELSVRDSQIIKLGLQRKVKWNYAQLVEKNSSTHSKTFIDQRICIWYSSRLSGYRNENGQNTLALMEHKFN